MPNWLLCWQVSSFLHPFPSVSNTYLMHHTCAPILILVSTWRALYIFVTSCKIGKGEREGERELHATPAIFKCNRALSLICYIQIEPPNNCALRQPYRLLIALQWQLRSSSILSSDWNWQLFSRT